MEQAPEYYPSGTPFREPAPTPSNNPAGMHQFQGQFGSMPARELAQPLYARPFIPFNSMEKLSGTEPLSDRRVWWEEYKYLARAGGWTDSEKCDHPRMYLTKSARVWYKQLSVKLGVQRLTWKRLAAAFKDEFLDSGEPAFEKYCYMSQAKNETPRQYLWRLNVAAKEAGIPIQEPAAVERHVTRFVSSLRDSPVRALLLGASFTSVEQLEMQLRLYERRSRPSRDDAGHRDRSASKSREASTYLAQQPLRAEDDSASDEDVPAEGMKIVRFQSMDEYDSDGPAAEMEDFPPRF
ncbi:hypothetical protein P43SY_011950 [Pythium insidiosum]|uniref:Retrotransposon gag domain-containing protein n=1 Tax=Pythium insidiosum TaxID=114742 RepID=A0AAD5Q124_PYTIN|nr:hypothetical protein P43SY_011950 [Pythium insidiosum]